MNEFEQIAQIETPKFEFPTLAPYEPLRRRPFQKLDKNRRAFAHNDPSRLLWVDDEFFDVPKNIDPIYLSFNKSKLDLITLVHRIAPHKAPYEDREWIKYLNGGGKCHSGDTVYLIHPLTAFFFARWLKTEFLSHWNLHEVFSPHAKQLVEMALDQFREADPVGYAYEMAGLKVAATPTELHVSTPNAQYKFRYSFGADSLLEPQQVMEILRASVKPCDSSPPIVIRPNKHPPFYKPNLHLPLWQEVYAVLGERLTATMMQRPNLNNGCAGCPVEIRDKCSFVFAGAEV